MTIQLWVCDDPTETTKTAPSRSRLHLDVSKTVYVTNWSNPRLHGPGRKLGIMVHPRLWEHGDGSVPMFKPTPEALADAKRGGKVSGDTVEAYRKRFSATVAARMATGTRGTLAAPLVRACHDEDARHGGAATVQDGDTLLCACSLAAAASGLCHRVWVANMLAWAGWRVVLDGVEVVAPMADPFVERAALWNA